MAHGHESPEESENIMGYVVHEVANRFKTGHLVVGTSRIRLDPATQWKLQKGILLRCPGFDDATPNTTSIWFGNQYVTADSNPDTGGFPIIPGAAVELPIDFDDSEFGRLWLISDAADQDIAWVVS